MFWKFWGVKCPPGCAPVPRVTLLVSKPAKWLRLFFVPKQLVMLIIMYQTNTEHPAVTFTMNPMRRTNLHSNVEVFMLLTLCTNFQVFAHFTLQFSPMKLCFWYLSCKHFPEITHQYIFCSPLFSLETFWSICVTLCCKRYISRHRT